MSKELPEVGQRVYVKFDDIEECEVVGRVDENEIEVEHQVSDGIEVVPVKEWFDKYPKEK